MVKNPKETLIKNIYSSYKNQDDYTVKNEEYILIKELFVIGILREEAFIHVPAFGGSSYIYKTEEFPFTKEFMNTSKSNPFLTLYQSTIAGIAEGITKGLKEQ